MNPNNSLAQSCVIPAQAGIQMIKKSPAKRGNIAVWPSLEIRRKRLVLSASRDVFPCWIPACTKGRQSTIRFSGCGIDTAGMTG